MPFEMKETKISAVKLIEVKKFEDNRGFFEFFSTFRN